jgi:hypothetical protein
MLEYNNHKKAKENHQLVVETVHKEVCKGWVLILPKKILPHLPYAMICPMGIVEQINYNLDGSITTKNRLTHDQTFTILRDSLSVNNITDLTKYPEMIYGFCASQIIHQAVTILHEKMYTIFGL